ncbi:unnamed protein product [Candidula unifasciata]|uniref:Saccharopine dehydrogenase (NAD(+), L-glutamate-forming) n=1 Tax=Candidula unifasciata TaxID=100452 RepID=A0A8S3YYB6_9EUPU|nr:unnamed protein product [Candidula unifasciata]
MAHQLFMGRTCLHTVLPFSRNLVLARVSPFQAHWMSDHPVMAIRRETVNVWERRAPLSPHQIKKLVKSGIKVIVQPSNRRAFSMKEFTDNGAVVQEDLSEASLIMGVKGVPIDSLLRDKTYAFFSHTIKAQADNMPMLDAIVEKNIRLIDYEKMVDEHGARVVAFGKYAGVAGMVNILHGMGLRLLALGHHTPFMHIGPSHNYRNTESARQAVRDAGYEIALGRLPKSIGPLTFVFTGSGNVSQGAQEVFQELPHEYVEPEYLPKVMCQGSMKKVYACVVSREDHYKRKDGGKFCAEEFEQHPERYDSSFSHNIAPYASCIINGIYWAVGSPRLITIPEAKTLLRPQMSPPWIPSSPGCPTLPHRLIAICDISADPGGSIEFMKECTTIDRPFSLYDAEQNVDKESFAGNGVLICSIDNMPAQIPRESTEYFGSLLLPYVEEMLKSNAKTPFEEYDCSPVVKNAVIASNGRLTPNFEYINVLRLSSKSAQKAKVKKSGEKIVILGAGYVSGPVVEYLGRERKSGIIVASQFQEELDTASRLCPNVDPILIDLGPNFDELENIIKDCDLVISLLPYTFHPDVAKVCIKNQKNMVTASYISPAMQDLHEAAKDAGITIMNEMGVDPGIDHMLAMECFDDVRRSGGKVTSYISYCGGIPAPENSASPLHYKFSWFPKGVLMNILSPAKHLKNGKVIEIAGNGGLLDAVEDLTFLPGLNLEGFPNRDSTVYARTYGIDSAHTVLRGTVRYKGFCRTVKGLVALGLFDTQENSQLHPSGPDITWKEFMCSKFNESSDLLEDTLKDHILEKLGGDHIKLDCIIRLGLIDDIPIDKRNTPIDTLSNYLSKRLFYGPDERDMIVMHHDVQVSWSDGRREQRRINFVNYGDPGGFSAMAKSVGLPTAIAARMILNGEIQTKGVCAPLEAEIYHPILQRLKKEGLAAREEKEILS